MNLSSTSQTQTNINPPTAPHVLVIPFPAQGHLIPLLDLIHHLPDSIAFTILSTPQNLPLIAPHTDNNPNIRPLVLPLPSHPSLPPNAEHVRDLPSLDLTASLIHALSFLTPPILSWAAVPGGPNPPVTAVLSDFFLGWTHRLARDLAVPRFAFYSSGALLASLLHQLFRHGQAAEHALVPPFRYDHLPSLYRRYQAFREGAAAPEWELVRESVIANSSSYAAVLNTFDALECRWLDHLRRGVYGHGRVWAVGPIPPAVIPGSVRGGRSSAPAEGLGAWLGACPPRSVVYVCFGSQFRMGGAHAGALEKALGLSGARFVWCVGPGGAEGEGRLELEERAGGRGLVVRGWAPQAEVLGHGSVGSFLTHCGWNSVLEGISAGVLLLTWPMEADQFVNARLLVEEAGVAVSACEGGPHVVPDPERLARVVADSVYGEKWPEVRARAEEMSRMAAEAVEKGGSSGEDMKKLADELLCCRTFASQNLESRP